MLQVMSFLTRDLILAYINALAAGDTGTVVALQERGAREHELRSALFHP